MIHTVVKQEVSITFNLLYALVVWRESELHFLLQVIRAHEGIFVVSELQ